jgi:hypothetical protein
MTIRAQKPPGNGLQSRMAALLSKHLDTVTVSTTGVGNMGQVADSHIDHDLMIADGNCLTVSRL